MIRRFYNTRITATEHSLQLIRGATKTNLNIHWLRDNCQCSLCIHPSTKQKTHSSGQISPVLNYKHLLTGTGNLQINWEANSLSSLPDTHTSVYPISWLIDTHTPKKPREPEYWTAESLKSTNLSLDYDNLSTTDLITQIKHHGLAFIRNVPTNSGSSKVTEIAQKLGYVRPTFYGDTFTVESIPDAKNIAYTSLYLALHMDLLYFESPPGIQYLHSLENSVVGGESIFLDSYKAVSILKSTHPEHYQTLKTTNMTFHYKNDHHSLMYTRPMIIDDNPNTPLQVSYSPPFQAPFLATSEFYAAYAAFNSILARPDLVYRVRLEEGMCAVFDNRRVLHGRDAFDGGSGRRKFVGCYSDLDDLNDKYRVSVGEGI